MSDRLPHSPAPTPTPPPAIALTIAGSDSSGGAGIQADLKTFAALGAYGASVVTALTAQNTHGIWGEGGRGILMTPPSFVIAQLDAVLDDLDVRAIKIGMLGDAAIMEALADRLGALREAGVLPPVVLDPVMVAKSGAKLLTDDGAAVRALRERLLPLASILTPNLPEAAVLLHTDEAVVQADPAAACAQLLGLGPTAVLLKGGHAGGDQSTDRWYARSDGAPGGLPRVVELHAARIHTSRTHGTGCTLSAAIAAGLAAGQPPLAAVRAAKAYVTGAIAAASRLPVGKPGGAGPLHHFHAWW